MKYELFIALRYLLRRRGGKFISVVTVIAVIGIGVGVGALITTLSVMSGFDTELKSRIVGLSPHIFIEKEMGIENPGVLQSQINNIEGVKGSFPYIYTQGIVEFRNRARGIVLRSVDTKNKTDAEKLTPHLISFATNTELEDGLIIGSELASALGVYVSDEISLVTPASKRSQKMKVTGIFKSGMYDYDANIVYAGLGKLLDLSENGAMVSGIGVDCVLLKNCEKIKTQITKNLDYRFIVTTWAERNRNLFSAIKLEKLAMFVILTLIVVVACFSIVGVLIMTVIEKAKDIGILKSIGASKKAIITIFSIQGFIMGTVGTILGFLGGMGVSFLLKEFVRLPAQIYYIDRIPIKFHIFDSVIIAVAALVISLLATIYPAYQAARLDPVKTLRYE